MRGEEMKMIAKAKQSTAKQNKIQHWDWSKARTRTQSKIENFVLVALQCLPILWQFCNPIPLAFKAKFPGGSQFLSRIPRLGNLWCSLELLQQCENFFRIIVLQFVGYLLGCSKVWLMVTSSKRAYTTHHTSQSAAARTPVLRHFTSN